jgi:hypothetical protein
MAYIRRVPERDRKPIEKLSLVDIGLGLAKTQNKSKVLDILINIGILLEYEGYQYDDGPLVGLAVGPNDGMVYIKEENETYPTYVVLQVSESLECEDKIFHAIVTDEAVEVYEYKTGKWEQVLENLANQHRGTHGKRTAIGETGHQP